ncbi:hypothetical protein LA080_009503 [Diaporthe eres]|nr:hypothetical protein LA080_009503 [Diaporthe eres]
MLKDDVVATTQAKKKVRTLRLGTPTMSYDLTNEVLKLASLFLLEARVSSNDSNTVTSGSSPSNVLHRLRNQTTQLLTIHSIWQMDYEGTVEQMPLLYGRRVLYCHYALVVLIVSTVQTYYCWRRPAVKAPKTYEQGQRIPYRKHPPSAWPSIYSREQ